MTDDALKYLKKDLKEMRETVRQLTAETNDLEIADMEEYQRTLEQFEDLKDAERKLKGQGDKVKDIAGQYRDFVAAQVEKMRETVDLCARTVCEKLADYERTHINHNDPAI